MRNTVTPLSATDLSRRFKEEFSNVLTLEEGELEASLCDKLKHYENANDVLIPEVIERYKTICHCLQDKRHIETKLPKVLVKNIEHFNHYVHAIPGFETIWTPKKKLLAEEIISHAMQNKD